MLDRKLFYSLPLLAAFSLIAQTTDRTWDLVATYQASTHVFYGELVKTLPEPQFHTGVKGVYVEDIDWTEIPTEEIIWPEAKHLTFKVNEAFKGPPSEIFEAYRADADPRVWTYIRNELDDVYLVKPGKADPLVEQLAPGDRGLFFIRDYTGSNIPVLYRVRIGQPALEDLQLLRMQRSSGNMPLAQIVQQVERRKQAEAQREQAEFKKFEDEYYKILRIQDLEIRQSLLKDLVTRLGYEGRWSFYGFKERYLKQYGAYLDDETSVPSAPPPGKELLWKNASEELSKIEVILKARQQ